MVDIEDIPAEVLNAATVQSSPVLAPGDIIDISVVAKNQEVDARRGLSARKCIESR